MTVSKAVYGEVRRSGVCVMSAEIIRLADVRMRRGKAVPPFAVAPVSASETPPRFHFWSGASGKRYVHTVYSLFDCPPIEDANYILVRRADSTTRTVLAIGRLCSTSAPCSTLPRSAITLRLSEPTRSTCICSLRRRRKRRPSKLILSPRNSRADRSRPKSVKLRAQDSDGVTRSVRRPKSGCGVSWPA